MYGNTPKNRPGSFLKTEEGTTNKWLRFCKLSAIYLAALAALIVLTVAGTKVGFSSWGNLFFTGIVGLAQGFVIYAYLLHVTVAGFKRTLPRAVWVVPILFLSTGFILSFVDARKADQWLTGHELLTIDQPAPAKVKQFYIPEIFANASGIRGLHHQLYPALGGFKLITNGLRKKYFQMTLIDGERGKAHSTDGTCFSSDPMQRRTMGYCYEGKQIPKLTKPYIFLRRKNIKNSHQEHDWGTTDLLQIDIVLAGESEQVLGRFKYASVTSAGLFIWPIMGRINKSKSYINSERRRVRGFWLGSYYKTPKETPQLLNKAFKLLGTRPAAHQTPK